MSTNNFQATYNFCNMMLICLTMDPKFFELKGNSKISILDEEDGDYYDDMITLLANNGCRLSDNLTVYYVDLDCSPIDLIFIGGALGNEANEFFDYIEFDGLNAIVIFKDHFANIIHADDPIPDDPVQKDFIENFGNSGYYDDIKRISDIYLALISNPAVHMNMLAATAAANMYRWNSSIIAAYVLDKIKPITDVDITDMSIEKARRLITELPSRLKGLRILAGEDVE